MQMQEIAKEEPTLLGGEVPGEPRKRQADFKGVAQRRMDGD